VTDVQQQVQEAIDDLVDSGAERGLQVAVYQDGRQIVDAVAGVTDPRTGQPVTPGTLFYAYSVGKAATSTVAHVLIERGLFDYDTRIADLWPEFAAHGKEGATIRHALTQSVGVPGVPSTTTPEDLCDWDKMCQIIADSEPWWEPGTKTGYHALTYGYIIGEVVRRVTGKRISQVLREEVTEPLGIADELYFGMPASEHGRLARLEDAPGSAEFMASIPDDSPMFRSGPRDVWPDATFGNRTDILEADIPAGGKLSARAGARLFAALLGEVDGVQLLSPEHRRDISTVALRGEDQVFGNPTAWTLGFAAGRLGAPQENPTEFAWGGVGGSFAFADTATNTAFALTKNLLGDFTSAERLSNLVMQQVTRK
jgi:CubicO group peptidase (beta-lactamase class C family)